MGILKEAELEFKRSGRSATSLRRTQIYSKAASEAGYDWENIYDVEAKLLEEFAELVRESSISGKIEEIGDMIFVLVNMYRWLGGADPDKLMDRVNKKFYNRFGSMEAQAENEGKEILNCTKEDFARYWGKAKEIYKW